MKKNEYMERVRNALQIFDREIADEIISDYEEHFQMGALKNKSEDQICNELGSIEDLVSELTQLSASAGMGNNSGEKVNFEVPTGDANSQGTEQREEKKDENKYNKLDNDVYDDVDVLENTQEDTEDAQSDNGSEFTGSWDSDSRNGYKDETESWQRELNKAMKDVQKSLGGMGKDISASVSSLLNEVAEQIKTAEINGEIVVDKNGRVYASGKDTFKNKDNRETQSFSNDESASGVDTVIIDALCADVYIEHSKEQKITFDYNNNGSRNQKMAYRFNHRQDGNVIRAEVAKVGMHSGFFANINSPQIELFCTIPENLKNVIIKTRSGDIKLKDVRCAELVIESISGDVSAERFEAARLNIKSTSGDVKVSKGGAKVVRIETISGDIQSLNVNSDKIELKSMSGDIDCYGGKRQMTLSTMSGDLDIRAIGDCECKASSISGDIKCKLEDCSGYTATVTSISGDISLSYKGQSRDSEGMRGGRKSGVFTFGSGASKLNLTTTSGDIQAEVR